MGGPPNAWPWKLSQKPGQLKIYDIVGADIYPMEPALNGERFIAIVAHGHVGTTGWTNLRLEPSIPVAIDEEFVLDIEIVGDPPPPGELYAVITIPVTVDSVLAVGPLCLGVRLVSWQNEVVCLFAEQTTKLPNYSDLIPLAVEFVARTYPDAKLYEVTVTPSIAGDPSQLSTFSSVFQVDGGHVVLKSAPLGLFSPIQYSRGPWLGDTVIHWPTRLSLLEADKALKDAGFEDGYVSVTLRQPLYPGVIEPSYIFLMQDRNFVFVGANDGAVKKGP